MRLVGGNLALDFVNTRSGPPVGPADDDAIADYTDLVGWSVYAGSLTEAEAEALRMLAREDPGGVDVVLAHARTTRDHLDGLFRALAHDRTPSPASLARLRDDEADALGHAHLDRGTGFEWSWRADRTLERPLRPIAHAAAGLLTAGALDRIKQCGGCRFLFFDESKNRSRRWCSMADCGTTEKVRRYVAARRTSAARATS